MSTEIQPVPDVILASEFPSLADRPAGTYNAKAKAWADSENAMSVRLREIALVTMNNALVAEESAASVVEDAQDAREAAQQTAQDAAQTAADRHAVEQALIEGPVLSVNEKNGVVTLLPRDLLPLQIITSSQTLTEGVLYGLDTGSGSFEVNLPAAPVSGMRVSVGDVAATWGDNPPVVNGSGAPIMGEAEPMTLDVSFVVMDFVYINTTRGWVIA